MSTAFTSERRTPEAELGQFSPDQMFAPPSPPVPGLQPGIASSQALFGNASVANAGATTAITPPDPRQLQSAFGNSVVARATEAQPATAAGPESPQPYKAPEGKPRETETASPPLGTPGEGRIKPRGPEARGPEATEERKAEEPARKALSVTAPEKLEKEKEAGEKPGKERAVLPPAEAEVAPPAAGAKEEAAAGPAAAESAKT